MYKKYISLGFVCSAKELQENLKDTDQVFMQMQSYLEDHGSDFTRVMWMKHDGRPSLYWYEWENFYGKVEQTTLPALYNEVAYE